MMPDDVAESLVMPSRISRTLLCADCPSQDGVHTGLHITFLILSLVL